MAAEQQTSFDPGAIDTVKFVLGPNHNLSPSAFMEIVSTVSVAFSLRRVADALERSAHDVAAIAQRTHYYKP